MLTKPNPPSPVYVLCCGRDQRPSQRLTEGPSWRGHERTPKNLMAALPQIMTRTPPSPFPRKAGGE